MAVAVAPEPTEVFNWPFRVAIVPLEVNGTSAVGMPGLRGRR